MVTKEEINEPRISYYFEPNELKPVDTFSSPNEISSMMFKLESSGKSVN